MRYLSRGKIVNVFQPLFVFPETGAKVRVVHLDGAPWFVAADVCRALSLNMVHGANSWLRSVPAADRREISRAGHPEIFSGSFASRFGCLSEAGLYRLVMRASPGNKPEVAKFQDWVTRDVLPAIRKDGVYVRGEEMLKVA